MRRRLYILIPIDIAVEREALFHRLKRYIEVCERILEDPNLEYELKLKAAAVLAQLASRAEKVITDLQLDEIEEWIDELEGKVKRRG